MNGYNTGLAEKVMRKKRRADLGQGVNLPQDNPVDKDVKQLIYDAAAKIKI